MYINLQTVNTNTIAIFLFSLLPGPEVFYGNRSYRMVYNTLKVKKNVSLFWKIEDYTEV